MKRVTAKKALDALVEVVQGNEDFVYPKFDHKCVYVHDGAPSCLVGQVLFKLGVPLADLKELDKDSTRAYRIPNYIPKVSDEAAQVLNSAQCVQDMGRPWRKALEAAQSRYEEVKS